MSRNRARLPEARSEHLRVLRIENETRYDGKAVRSLVTACLRFLGLRVRGVVRVTYSAEVDGHHGVAAMGGPGSWGVNMALTVPRDPSHLDEVRLARLVHHEALHWKGVRHEDMTEDQRWVAKRGWVPSWYSEWVSGRTVTLRTPESEYLVATIAFAPARTISKEDGRRKKLAHAERMLARAKKRFKLAATVEMRWHRRVVAARRAIERAEGVDTASVVGVESTTKTREAAS